MHYGIFPTLVLCWMLATLPTKSFRRMLEYKRIASAVFDACDDAECMSELASIAGYESDFTIGAKGPGGEIGAFQIKPAHLPKGEATPLEEQARIARMLVSDGKKACPGNSPEHALAGYASGRCDRGLFESELRVRLARDLLENGRGHIEREFERKLPSVPVS